MAKNERMKAMDHDKNNKKDSEPVKKIESHGLRSDHLGRWQGSC